MEYPSTGVSWLSILLAHIHAEQALEESRWRGKGHETCLLTPLWIGTIPLRLPTSLPHCPVCTAIAREGLCAQNFGYWSKASSVQRCGESWAGGRWDVNSIHFRTWYASKCMCLATFRPCWSTERRNSSEKNVILWLSGMYIFIKPTSAHTFRLCQSDQSQWHQSVQPHKTWLWGIPPLCLLSLLPLTNVELRIFPSDSRGPVLNWMWRY